MRVIPFDVLRSLAATSLAVPAVARNGWLLLAIGLHGVAFVAVGRPAALASFAESQHPNEVLVDLAAEATLDGRELQDGPRAHSVEQATARSPVRRQADVPLRRVPAAPVLPLPDTGTERFEGPRFALSVSSTPADRSATAPTDQGSQDVEPGSDAAPLSVDGVSSPARLLGALTPSYPEGAREQDVEADVVVTIVVSRAGAVSDARIVRRAGMGLDEAALDALRTARFAPAQRHGRPVAVRMPWTVSFRLR
jgi:TonB family protein